MTRTLATVACCVCGAHIEANPLTMCGPCIATNGDITSELPKSCELQHCRSCDRYLLPPKSWVVADWESRELLAVCLKKIKGLSKLKLIDASFIWSAPHPLRLQPPSWLALTARSARTEPHSRRVKVKLTVQADVYSGTVLEQMAVITFVVINIQCRTCQRAETANTWEAAVQLRQKVAHRRTFLYLEQLILTHRAQKEAINIKEVKEGMDFYFASKQARAPFPHSGGWLIG